ncbi:hypothetical protein TruAng_011485 [Truncatella angustata]|nr:hypothetical protein TruAng_011485 [Truncatella angustata]
MDDSRTSKRPSETIPDEELPVDAKQASLEKRFTFRHLLPVLYECGQDNNGHDVSSIVKEESPKVSEEEAEKALQPGIATVIDLTGDGPMQITPDTHGNRPPLRNAPIDHYDIWASYGRDTDGLVLKPGMVVEVNPIKDLYHASFLEIQLIIQTESGVVLRGLPYTRTRFLRGQLPRFRNEICLVLRVDADDTRVDEIQGAVEVPIADVVRARKFRCTNTEFPQHRFTNVNATIEEIERDGMLACRWKYRLVYQSSAARKIKRPPFEFVLAHLRADEISTVSTRVQDAARLNAWRGSKVRGGSYNRNTRQGIEAIEDLETELDTDRIWIKKQAGQRYTMGDMFCGAGGTSLGAQQAGFHIRVACDMDEHACETHKTNFPAADLRKEDIWNFIKEDVDWRGKRDYVDVLHLSPPCQFWSPAHTVAGKNDEANIAVLFSCFELIKKLRPRIFTLEQTFGILDPRFEHYFNALIHGFTQYSYSVRWKVVNFLEWGLPSRRNRLIMIGACPGESLPTFPLNTHARHPPPNSGLRPLTTVLDAMKKIPPSATLQKKRRRYWIRSPWDPNVPLSRCITTHGGFGNYHYKAQRDFTLREFATMNGFPATYQFHGKNIKRQIGNAFPPCVVRVLYGHLLNWLENEDRARAVENQSMYEEEGEYDIVDNYVDDDVEIIGERVKRRKSSSAYSAADMIEINAPFCIDPSQTTGWQHRSTVDLTTESPMPLRKMDTIWVEDDDDTDDIEVLRWDVRVGG